ncbi:MAG: putative transposase [Candidatus Berkelbacteria bacterium Licking1014_85]|uniref:Putative transposase n=1 Tax=Candidatus Berkelbacteria bacterium Licking1014_85 TaxID=2017148 RepID=A0A554LGZ2_9BACT|nr:MAG: putative transposase [Candidatus Berkelbacteria bacterium Licking1014_85]
MPSRNILTSGEYYHIFNRSIAGFKIFNDNSGYKRFIDTFTYYQIDDRPCKLSALSNLSISLINEILENKNPQDRLVTIISFCLMPTHFHLLLEQDKDNGIVKFMRLIENSYSRYFNILHKRKGPLWEGRFKSVHVDSDEQLLHLTRYIHLNPTSDRLVHKPDNWAFSSYKEYIYDNVDKNICDFKNIIDLSPKQYKEFVNDRKKYQQELSTIKAQLIDYYSG